jgi:diphthamide biosynthesis protein 3
MSIYDEIEIEDMTFDETLKIYHYPCPCGDRFEINIADLRDGEDIAVCPSCSLMIKVIFDVVSFPVSEIGYCGKKLMRCDRTTFRSPNRSHNHCK